ncbi:MAG: DUF4861 family protein [Bacteroidota bacterium]
MKNFTLLFLLLLVGFIYSCGDQKKVEQPTADTTKKTTETTASTQAFLLRQPHPYDPDSIKKISGEYQQLTKYEVPKNLKPHGFWLKFEGPTWENDLIGYRFYLDTRNRYDIFGKQTTDLVLDTVNLDYHKIHPWGSDILKVGNTLGMGSPAILYNDSLYAFEQYDAKRTEIVQSGGETSTIRTYFDGLKIGEEVLDIMVELSIQAGFYQTNSTIKILKSTNPNLVFATGIVAHEPDHQTGALNGHRWLATFGNQSYHEEKLGMAVFAHDKYQPRVLPQPKMGSHVLTLQSVDGQVEYALLATWERSRDQPQSIADFEAIVAKEINN